MPVKAESCRTASASPHRQENAPHVQRRDLPADLMVFRGCLSKNKLDAPPQPITSQLARQQEQFGKQLHSPRGCKSCAPPRHRLLREGTCPSTRPWGGGSREPPAHVISGGEEGSAPRKDAGAPQILPSSPDWPERKAGCSCPGVRIGGQPSLNHDSTPGSWWRGGKMCESS